MGTRYANGDTAEVSVDGEYTVVKNGSPTTEKPATPQVPAVPSGQNVTPKAPAEPTQTSK